MDDEGNWVQCSPQPWNRIVGPNPWCGGSVWQGGMVFGPQAQPVAPENEFHVVVSMAGRGEGMARITADDVVQHNFYITDDRLGPDEMLLVVEAVDVVEAAVKAGLTVLVRCHMGWNRSGLVVGLWLRKRGWGAQDAIERIRAHRSPHALFNEHFVKYIHSYPDHG